MSSPENMAEVDPALCKGCGVCVPACPKKCLSQGSALNAYGYQFAKFDQRGCTACGMCFYVCPEPGAITVYKGERRDEA
jgi:Pyruvate/2-oxoacid:ferredoxin oxidoreductase delta subunit